MAVSPSSYAVGNRVYRGGSSAPTMGTVDPMGYVERSMESQSRSGLASAALRRIRPGGQPGQPQQQFMGGGAAPGQSLSLPQMGAPPNIQSNAMGKLSLAPVAEVKPFEQAKEFAMPYDPQGSQDMLEAKRQRDLIINQLLEQQQDLNRNYSIESRDLETAQPNAFRSLLDGFAGRGMAFSSGYGDKVGETNNQFQNAAADMGGRYTAGINSIGNARNSAEEGYNTQGAAIMAAITRRQEERAREEAAQQAAASFGAMGGGGGGFDSGGGGGAPFSGGSSGHSHSGAAARRISPIAAGISPSLKPRIAAGISPSLKRSPIRAGISPSLKPPPAPLYTGISPLLKSSYDYDRRMREY